MHTSTWTHIYTYILLYCTAIYDFHRRVIIGIKILAVGVCCKASALAASAVATNSYVSAINLHQCSAAGLNIGIKFGP